MLDRDALVEVAVETDPGALEVARELEQRGQSEAARLDAAAVEAGGRAHDAEGRGVEGDGATHAVTHDRGRGGGVARLDEERGPREEVFGEALLVQLAHGGHRRGEVVVGHLGRAAAVKELGRDRVVALRGETLGHLADVVVHPEGLLDDDDGARRVHVARDLDGSAVGQYEFGDHSKIGPWVRVRFSS